MRAASSWERTISISDSPASSPASAASLHELGGDYSSIAKLTTYLVHSQDIAKFMKCRETLFPTIFPGGKYPPNTLLIIDRLVKEEFLIEVEAMAAI